MGTHGAFIRRKINQGLKLKNHTQISEEKKNAWICIPIPPILLYE
jgi:hypothetical protein